MAFNDNDELDLSYMDENTNDASNQGGLKSEPEDNVDFYDDDIDPNTTSEQNMAEAPAMDAANGETKPEYTQGTNAAGEDHSMTTDQTLAQESSGSKKRKERDDDEYSQTQSQSVSQTPQPASSTPMQQVHSSGQTATQALDIKQLPQEITEETLREWANTVNAESDIEELKFDEFKPNGKSKG